MINGLILLGDASDAARNVCHTTSGFLQIVGWVLTIFKIAIPLIIIALGLIDLGKAAVSAKPEEIKKCATSLIWRLVGGIAIFFLPALILAILSFVGKWGEVKNQTDFDTCYTCIITPWETSGNNGCHE